MELPIVTGLPTVLDELNLVAKTLTEAEKYNLECEVILAAMEYLRCNPEATIAEALQAGLNQWDV